MTSELHGWQITALDINEFEKLDSKSEEYWYDNEDNYAKHYTQLSEENKERFDQIATINTKIKLQQMRKIIHNHIDTEKSFDENIDHFFKTEIAPFVDKDSFEFQSFPNINNMDLPPKPESPSFEVEIICND